MNKKTLLLIAAISKSMMFWISISLFWLLKDGVFPNFNQLSLFIPYYLLWITLTTICLIRTGRIMKILWIGSMRNPEVFSRDNIPSPFALSRPLRYTERRRIMSESLASILAEYPFVKCDAPSQTLLRRLHEVQ